jgi:hypothetical protein
VGTALLKLPEPGRARRQPAATSVEADDRDRRWTLGLKGYDMLWRAGACLFGHDQIGARVPALQAHQGGRPKKPALAPVPPPAPPAQAARSRPHRCPPGAAGQRPNVLPRPGDPPGTPLAGSSLVRRRNSGTIGAAAGALG